MTEHASPTPRIVRTKGVVGGAWRLDGTRMPVKTLHDLAVLEGMSTEAILSWYPHLRATQVEYAVAWFDGAYHRARRRRQERGR